MMAKTMLQTVDRLWKNWLDGVEFTFQSGKQAEKAFLENLDEHQRLLALFAENSGKLKQELIEQFNQFYESTKKEFETVSVGEQHPLLTKWLAQFKEITNRFIQITFTPAHEFHIAYQTFHNQTSNLIRQYLSQQQTTQEEANELFKLYIEKIKEMQKNFIVKANDSSFFH